MYIFIFMCIYIYTYTYMVGGCSPPSPPPYMGGEKPPCTLHVGLCAPPLAPRSCVFPPSSHPVMQKANASGVVIYVQNLF